ncbi:MAG: nucleoside deaminase [Bacteroidia bacterium]|nr:MAG: nucleoside deaminase [Bacteroidia bacterium]
MCKEHHEYIRQAVDMAAENVGTGLGGPFGALIVKDGKIIGRGVNRVTSIKDPTAHAEVMAIRDACRQIDDYRLEGAVIYTSCEPCPMCLSAIYWARLDGIYFAAYHSDAAKAGFDDSFIYNEIPLPFEKRAIPIRQIMHEDPFKPFSTWIDMENKIKY